MWVGEGGRVAVGRGVAVSVLRMTVAVAAGDAGARVTVALGVLMRAGGVGVTSGDGEEVAQLLAASAIRRKARVGRAMPMKWATLGLSSSARAL